MQKTLSERTFEDYCASKGIAYRRVPESEMRTPDYELLVSDQIIFVEVKEITANKEEQESDRVMKERGYGNVLSHTPGDRVRKKIADCSAQIKARGLGRYPCMLVLFDRGRACGHVDQYSIRVAMYGLEQVHLAVPPIGIGSPYITGMGYGPKRKMTQEHNTSISAIGALFMTGPDETLLYLYHNKFAQVPLELGLLGQFGIKQFQLEDERFGATAKWHAMTLGDEP